jgi:quercetin dioxygenase-like cupin family protein
MKNVTVGVFAAILAATGTAGAQQTLSPAAERPTSIGSADYFTGQVMVEPIFDASEHRNVSAAMVTFQPGARSAWHTHPIGQTLVVVSGTGWTGTDSGEKQVIAAGDVIWCPPDVRHWHGATDTNAMRHIAVTGFHDESGAVNWLEHVTDEQYMGD